MAPEGQKYIDQAGITWIQDRIRDLLADLNRVASDAGFDYFLAYGTALGAVRDGDVIPWDPDADVFLPINQYDEVVSILSSQLSDQYEVLRPGHGGYEHLFARLAIRGIDHKIIRVDLFPLCRAPAGQLHRRLLSRYQRGLALAYMLKRVRLEDKSHYSTKKRFLAMALRAVLSVIPASAVEGAYRKLLRNRDINSSTETLVNPQGSYGSREFFDARWFAQSRPAMVGGVSHPVPVGVEALLTQLYGNYEQPIPPARVIRELEFITEHYVEPLRATGWLLPPRAAG